MLEWLFGQIALLVGDVVAECLVYPVKRYWARLRAARRLARFTDGETVSIPCSLRRLYVSSLWMQGSLEVGAAAVIWHPVLDVTQPSRFPPTATVCLSRRRVENPELESSVGDSAFLIARRSKEVEIAVMKEDAEVVELALRRFHARAGAE